MPILSPIILDPFFFFSNEVHIFDITLGKKFIVNSYSTKSFATSVRTVVILKFKPLHHLIHFIKPNYHSRVVKCHSLIIIDKDLMTFASINQSPHLATLLAMTLGSRESRSKE